MAKTMVVLETQLMVAGFSHSPLPYEVVSEIIESQELGGDDTIECLTAFGCSVYTEFWFTKYEMECEWTFVDVMGQPQFSTRDKDTALNMYESLSENNIPFGVDENWFGTEPCTPLERYMAYKATS